MYGLYQRGGKYPPMNEAEASSGPMPPPMIPSTVGDRLHKGISDVATGVATWGTSFRPPTQGELQQGRGTWVDRTKLLAGATTQGLTNELVAGAMGKIASKIVTKSVTKSLPKPVSSVSESPYPVPTATDKQISECLFLHNRPDGGKMIWNPKTGERIVTGAYPDGTFSTYGNMNTMDAGRAMATLQKEHAVGDKFAHPGSLSGDSFKTWMTRVNRGDLMPIENGAPQTMLNSQGKTTGVSRSMFGQDTFDTKEQAQGIVDQLNTYIKDPRISKAQLVREGPHTFRISVPNLTYQKLAGRTTTKSPTIDVGSRMYNRQNVTNELATNAPMSKDFIEYLNGMSRDEFANYAKDRGGYTNIGNYYTVTPSGRKQGGLLSLKKVRITHN